MSNELVSGPPDGDGDDDAAVAEIVGQVLAADLNTALTLVAHHLTRPGIQDGTPLALFLRSYWDLLEALRVIQQEGRFDLAIGLLDEAAEGLGSLGLSEPAAVAQALSGQAHGVLELQRGNIESGQKQFESVEKHLRQAGAYTGRFQPLIDHQKPDALFIGVIPAMLAGDIASARALAAQAAHAAREVARRYHEEGSPLHYSLLGMAEYYGSVLSFHEAQLHFGNFDLEELVGKDLAAQARTASQLLSKGDLTSVQIRNVLHLALVYKDLLEALGGIAEHAKRHFDGTLQPGTGALPELERLIRSAERHVQNAGLQAVSMSRVCQQLLARLRNLEKLTLVPRRHLAPTGDKIFIVHGHGEGQLRNLQLMLEKEFRLEVVILKDLPGAARTLIQKFEEAAEQCGYAIVLMTRDDVVKKGKDVSYFQSRPNVLFETGWFFGRWGPDRLCIVMQEGTVPPSDLEGIMTIDFHDRVNDIQDKLDAEFQRAGILGKPAPRRRAPAKTVARRRAPRKSPA